MAHQPNVVEPRQRGNVCFPCPREVELHMLVAVARCSGRSAANDDDDGNASQPTENNQKKNRNQAQIPFSNMHRPRRKPWHHTMASRYKYPASSCCPHLHLPFLLPLSFITFPFRPGASLFPILSSSLGPFIHILRASSLVF